MTDKRTKTIKIVFPNDVAERNFTRDFWEDLMSNRSNTDGVVIFDESEESTDDEIDSGVGALVDAAYVNSEIIAWLDKDAVPAWFAEDIAQMEDSEEDELDV